MVSKSTRKGLSLGAIVALLFSVLGAMPAKAAGEVTLAPSAGTLYSTLVDQTFTLDAALAPGVNNSFATQLKYKIEAPATSGVTWAVDGATDAYSGSAPVASTSWVVNGDATALVASNIAISLTSATTSSASVEVTVTAFVDADNDSALDAGEWQQARTVKFVKWSEATADVSMTAVTGGATKLSAASATLTDINMKQVQGALSVQFLHGVSNYGSSVSADADGVYSVSDAVVSDSATVSAKLMISNVVIATSTAVDVTDRTIEHVTVSAVKGANAKASGAGTTARVNTTFQVQIKTATSSSAAVSVGNVSGTWKLTTSRTDLTSTRSITANGTTYTSTASLPTAAAFTTGADGLVNVTLATVGFVNGDTLTLAVTAQNRTETHTITLNTASYTIKNESGDEEYATPGSTVNFSWSVKDQWGEYSALADRLKIAFSSAEAFTLTTQYVNLSSGQASLAYTGKGTLSGTVTVSASLEEQDSATLNWSAATATADDHITVSFNAATLKFDSDPLSDSASVSGATATVSGSVNQNGATVTITGAGLTFTEAADTDNTAVGSLVVKSVGPDGHFTVSAHSKVAGTYSVTVAAGTYSKALVITIDAIDAAAATKMSIEQVGGGSYVTPGSTLRVKVTLTDDNGNVAANSGASLSMTVTGPGFVGTLPTKTDANGEATLNVLLGSQDTGTVKVEGSFAGTKTVTSSAEFTVGTAPAAEVEKKITVGSFKGFIAIYTKGYEGSKLSAKVAGKWLVVPSLSNWSNKDYSRTVRFTGAGYLIQVHLYIDGEFVRTDEVTTK